jgi:hypothetical protein
VTELKSFLRSSYPNISIQAKPWEKDPSRLALYFQDEKFSALYPKQRYHYIAHSIPQRFHDEHLSNTVWFELAPGEDAKHLLYPDDELMASIAPDVLQAIEQAGVTARLDDLLAPEDANASAEHCHGDFRHLKKVLAEKGFGQRGEIDEIFGICHVAMAKGGYCDCEVLYNVSGTNRLKSRYWAKRAHSMGIDDPVTRSDPRSHET